MKTTRQSCQGALVCCWGFAKLALSSRRQLQPIVLINCIAGSQVAHRTLKPYKQASQPNCRVNRLRQTFRIPKFKFRVVAGAAKRDPRFLEVLAEAGKALTIYRSPPTIHHPIRQKTETVLTVFRTLIGQQRAKTHCFCLRPREPETATTFKILS